MASEPGKEKSGLEHVSAAAGAVKGAIKAGKALAGEQKVRHSVHMVSLPDLLGKAERSLAKSSS